MERRRRCCNYLLTLFIVSTCFFLRPCNTKYVEGILDTTTDWSFLARFCFLSEVGELRYEISYPKLYAVQNLYLYYDSPNQWPAVYHTKKTCYEKEAVLHKENYQIVNLSTWTVDGYSYPGCQETYHRGDTWFLCTRSIKFNSYRERWWFLAVGNCNTTLGLYMEYKLWMTNGHPDDFWFFQFSADEFYILPTDIPFLLIEVFTFVTAVVISLILRARQMLHTTYKLFMTSLFIECLSLLCLCIAYGDYAKNGVGLPYFKLLGNMFEAISVLVFQFMLILMAKGYTITRGRLSKSGSIKISVFMTIYSIAYAAVFIYQARFFDPGLVTYLYESPAGYCLIVIRIVGWLWFCYAIYFTLVHYPLKRGFYLRFATFFSLWFWMGPCMIIVANHIIGKWMREKIVNGVEKAVALSGYLFFLVSCMDGDDAPHVQTNFPRSAYELNPSNYNPQRYDIFTINTNGARNEESTNNVPFKVWTTTNLPAPTTQQMPQITQQQTNGSTEGWHNNTNR